ncbi:uridine phosphorylase [Anaeramoeba flamelloides]|uniref:Uridine phosphorylase n=1 Tax=Anaeramoeba flamelloides TaxID=1746091 RepID=A0AAV7ZH73_9EUKA|nr:uridine phosphorylase [Anaeramoeba flamelloides]KAJ6242584.1 uridine phosphorylase [Anaeramoeba flamelloides]|eukprot:Anaeramoba_flamelloidesa88749_576.p1 GENE.a88749_576~~a88749_576.p1  ORF type:complete len:332 (+),score=95.92 a88749_576:38-1033(+)
MTENKQEKEEKKNFGKHIDDVDSVDLPIDQEGRIYHIGLKKGELANRILTVGDPGRAGRISKQLDKVCFEFQSNRGYYTYTGLKNGVPISIVATGMGFPLVDFMVRESAEIVDGDMVFLRFGTCGVVREDIPIGNIVISTSSIMGRRDYNLVERQIKERDNSESNESYENKWGQNKVFPYEISEEPILANEKLCDLLEECLGNNLGKEKVSKGLNLSADSFYSTQGRKVSTFFDHNQGFVEMVQKKFPDFTTMEMETYIYFHLAKSCVKKNIYASAACIALAQRISGKFLKNSIRIEREKVGGLSCLEALSKMPLEKEMSGKHCVWEKKEN